MKLIIPMAGTGQRFLEVGYEKPKFLLRVEGKPIIEHVLDMFPGENEVIFICNEDDLSKTELVSILKELKSNAKIVSIKPHKKGPLETLSHAFEYIDDADEVLVSYCDFVAVWDYEVFKKDVRSGNWSAAIPSYIGFHPHLIHDKLYAGVLVDHSQRLTAIQEKHCFTDDPMDCYQSAGIFYFKNGGELKTYAEELKKKQDISINGEQYLSMLFYLYNRDGKPIFVPELLFFAQWGTPEDLEEYEAWMRLIAHDGAFERSKTDMPPHREVNIRIPVSEGSEEFKQSYNYWKSFLLK